MAIKLYVWLVQWQHGFYLPSDILISEGNETGDDVVIVKVKSAKLQYTILITDSQAIVSVPL